MLALPLTIFIYQLVATFGVTALTATVIALAPFDFQLMYMQGPLDKVLHWKRFKSRKEMLLLLTLISIVIMFFPTLLVYGTENMDYEGYTLSDIQQESQKEEYSLNPMSNPNPIVLPITVQKYPPFDDFRVLYQRDALNSPSEYSYRNWVNAESIVKTYLYKQLNVPVTKNRGGVWYGVMANLTNRAAGTNEQGGSGDTYRLYNLYQRQYEAPIPQRVDASSGRYYTDTNVSTYTFGAVDQDSFSLHACHGQLVYNLSGVDNHQILAVRNASAGAQCYPQFDASLPVSVQVGSSIKSSVLDDRYGVYRSARFDKAKKSTSAISVSAMKLNDTFITMAIKKQTHLTYHGQLFNETEKELLNCSPANLDYIYHNQKNSEYNAYNHTRILCQLKQLAQQDANLSTLQAVRRAYGPNATIHSVYTYMAPTKDNPLGGFGIDLAYFTALTLESALFNFAEEGEEHLIAHSFKDGMAYTSASSVEALVDMIDIFSTDDMTDPTLPNLVKIQASLKANNFYYFSKWTASVHFAYDMAHDPTWMHILIGLGSVFVLVTCFGCTQRKQSSLRALISACPTDEKMDDTATLVEGRSHSAPPKAQSDLEKPTKFALVESSSSTSTFPVLTVDGKAIVLEYTRL